MSSPNKFVSTTNFTGGVWSPELAGRIDLPQFKNAVKSMVNFLPIPRGGAKVRPGSLFVARTKYSDKATRLIPFEFNTEQSYMLEFGDFYIRFFANGQRLETDSAVITNVSSNGGQIRVTSASHGFSNGDIIAIRNVKGTSEANGDWTIENVATDTFDLVGQSFVNTYLGGGTAALIYEIVSPYPESVVFAVKSTQTADTMYLFHPDYPTQLLTRVDAAEFTITRALFVAVPEQDLNRTADTISSSGFTDNAATVLTASGGSPFADNVVGDYIRVGNGFVRLTVITNPNSVNGIVTQAHYGGDAAANGVFPNVMTNAAVTAWAQGMWNDDQGYPRAGIFFENRLVVGGTTVKPQSIWGSRSGSGNYNNFDASNTGDDFSFEYEVASKQANIIRWFAGDNDLLIGTSGREFKMTGSQNGGITPTSVFARPQSRHGSLDTEPAETTSGTVFLQRSGKKSRLLSYQFVANSYLSPDVTLLSNRISGNSIDDVFVQVAYEAEPNEVIWHLRSDGGLASLTLLSDQNITAWSRQMTDGDWKAVASMVTTGDDQTWTICDRTIDNSTHRYVEYFYQPIALDSAIVATFNSPVSTISAGLDHLEGLEVTIVGDGATYPNQTVTNGALPEVLDPTITSIAIGLPYTPVMEMFRPDMQLNDGDTINKKLKVVQVTLRVDTALGLQVNGELNYVRSTADLMDTPVDPETDNITFSPDLDWNQTVVITQHLPFPAQVLAASYEVEIGD